MKQRRIVNFGSLNIDFVYQTDHIVRPGETTASDSLALFAGGKGLNQSIAAARAGLSVFHAGLLGEDGDMLTDALEKDGVDTRFVARVPGRSGHTIIQVDKDAQNAILLFGGSNRAVTAQTVRTVFSHFTADDVLLLQNEVSCVPEILRAAADIGMEIWFNPSPMDKYIDACDLSLITVFLLNEVEGEALTGTAEPAEILNRMAEKYPNAAVVLTLGGAGAWYAGKGTRCFCPAVPVKAVDTTAAGDTFTGYFLRGMLQNRGPEASLALAAKAAAVAVSRAGASPSIPRISEIEP